MSSTVSIRRIVLPTLLVLVVCLFNAYALPMGRIGDESSDWAVSFCLMVGLMSAMVPQASLLAMWMSLASLRFAHRIPIGLLVLILLAGTEAYGTLQNSGGLSHQAAVLPIGFVTQFATAAGVLMCLHYFFRWRLITGEDDQVHSHKKATRQFGIGSILIWTLEIAVLGMLIQGLLHTGLDAKQPGLRAKEIGSTAVQGVLMAAVSIPTVGIAWLLLAKGIGRWVGGLFAALGSVGLAAFMLHESSGGPPEVMSLLIGSMIGGLFIVSTAVIYVWRSCGFRLRRTARRLDALTSNTQVSPLTASGMRARMHFTISLVLLLAMLCGVIWQAIGNIPKRARIAKQMYWQRNGFSASVDHAGHIESLTAMRNSDEALAAPGFDPIAALAELPDAPTIIINGPQADASIKQLAKCEAIRELKLAGSDVTDAGLASVAKMTGLESLDLSRTSVTNAGIAHLKSLPNLRHLNLANVNAITDEVAAHLATFPKLEWINLPQNAVTVESLDRLRRALPDVQIISRP